MRIFGLLTAIMFLAAAASASTINVPGQYSTIQEAINNATGGDVVLVDPGTYVENIDFLGKNITVKSASGPAVTVIDGGQNGSVVLFQGGEGRTALLEGFRITNGYAPSFGGGIDCWQSSPTIRLNVIDGCWAPGGGCAIACRDADCSPLIQKNEITAQSWSYSWGAIYCSSASAVIEANDLHDNPGDGIVCVYSSYPVISGNSITANTGHGIFCDGLTPEITDNHIWHNDRRGIVSIQSNAGTVISRNRIHDNLWGGIEGRGTLSIVGNQIYDNWNEGILCTGSVTVSHNAIFRNTTATYGGGIYCDNASATIINNLICDNSAQYGGGIYFWVSYQTLTNNTIVGNRAEAGGGLYCNGNVPTITNTILWDNLAFDGSEICDPSSKAFVTYCNVQGGWTGAGNIDSDPLFCPEPGDYHLTLSSPCRNAGDNSAPLLPDDDFEGDERVTSGTVDIGADEFHTHLYCLDEIVPGDQMRIGIAGPPNKEVLLVLSAGVNDPPIATQYGDLYVVLPFLKSWNLGTIPGEGILILSTTVPPTWSSGEKKYFQALVGPLGNPNSELTNLLVLEVD